LTTQSNQITSFTDLISKCINNDRKAQHELYNHFSGKMYYVCLRYAIHPDDAQDILQDGFVKLFRNLEKFRNEGSFEGWVRRIFVNTAIEHLRKKVDITSINESHEEQIEFKEVTGLNKLQAQDIHSLIAKLSPGYKAVFNLYEVEGYSHIEVAEILSINVGTSKSQLARAKAILKKELTKLYPDLDRN
jgi:RNA polymerase sigma factor (sigma-70 family)